MRIIFLTLTILLTYFLWAQEKYTYFTSKESNIFRRGVLLDNGKELIEAKYKYIFHTAGHFFVYNDSMWGWYDNAGKMVMKPQFTDVGYGMVDSMLRVKKNGLWGYIDINGNEKIAFQYQFACNFDQGKAYVLLDGEAHYIDPSGKLLAEKPKYTFSDYCPEDTEIAEELPDGFDFNPNREKVEVNGLFGVVDSSSNEIIPAKYDGIGTYYNGVIEVEKNGKFGAYKDNGKLICEPKYHRLGLFNNLE